MATIPPPLRRQEWALLASAYLSQFVASSFFIVALMAILRDQGQPLAHLSWLYLLGLLPSLKFLWAPLLDRHGFGARGHYSMWLALMQAFLVITLLGLSQLDVRADAPVPLPWLMFGCVVVAFLTACQDIAADGISCRLLGPKQRGMGNAVQMAAGLVGFAAGGGGVLMMYERWGWRIAILGLIVLNLITLVQALLYREPAHARPLRHAPDAPLHAYWQQLWRFWRRPDTGLSWALLVMTIQVGAAMASGVLTPMLVDSGWELGRIGRVVNIYGCVVGVTTTLLLGIAMRRWPTALVMRWMLPAQVLAIGLLAIPLLLRAGDGPVLLGVAGYLALYIPLGTLVATLMMGRACPSAPATDFSMQYGLHGSAIFAASALALMLAQRWGYPALLTLSAALATLAVFSTPWLWQRANAATGSSMHTPSVQSSHTTQETFQR